MGEGLSGYMVLIILLNLALSCFILEEKNPLTCRNLWG